ncbi:translation machinery-associated protein 20 [Malassezia cuniculi]|uniref:Translation machinery-associated protein 20 n=1 Tax=Malassezia cuniculi TaxID=948313 RepID=A0AAF0J603_9BASI|nr:translation machinery-associated protein 20 [Malassezia cuniculi]
MSLFRKIDAKADLGAPASLKSSIQRAIRTKLVEQFPESLGANDGALLDQIWPKKEPVTTVKFKREHVQLIVVRGMPIFFQQYDGPFVPTLRVLHQYPDLLPKVQVDRGAIRFVLSGANIMAPGLTSAGGRLPEERLEKGTIVGVNSQGKEYEVSVGVLNMASDEIAAAGKGIAIDNLHCIGDDLWMICARGGL